MTIEELKQAVTDLEENYAECYAETQRISNEYQLANRRQALAYSRLQSARIELAAHGYRPSLPVHDYLMPHSITGECPPQCPANAYQRP